MKALVMGLVVSFMMVGCGTDEPGPRFLPQCCDGQVAADYESVLMCKQIPNGEQSSIFVKRSEVGMIDTMKEMQFETCE